MCTVATAVKVPCSNMREFVDVLRIIIPSFLFFNYVSKFYFFNLSISSFLEVLAAVYYDNDKDNNHID